jgi:hypothetical protein
MGPSYEVNNHAAGQEIPVLSRNPTVYFRVQKNPSLDPTSIHSNPFYPLKSYFSIIDLSSHLILGSNG